MSHTVHFVPLPRSRPITQHDRRRQRAAFGDQGAASAVLINSSLSAPCSTSDLATAATGKEIKLQPCDQGESTSLCATNPAYRTAASVVPVGLFLRCRMSRPKKNRKKIEPTEAFLRPAHGGWAGYSIDARLIQYAAVHSLHSAGKAESTPFG